jgi:VIT1/CCC1 family predicted Fe2+/Mn2+ transporter
MLADELANDKHKCVEFMMKYELGLEEPNPNRATKSVATIGFSYVVGGMIPLSRSFFTTTPTEGLKISVVITLVCLFILGYYKSILTGQPVLAGSVKVMIIGALAAAVFDLAKLIKA